MVAKLLDGKSLAAANLNKLKEEINQVSPKRPPCLVTILVGNEAASELYIRKKRETCEQLGFLSKHYPLPNDVTADKLFALIKQLNEDRTIDGILVQLPLPEHLPTKKILDLIAYDKDVDGFHPQNVGKLLLGMPGLVSCTPKGIMQLIALTKVNLTGLTGLVVGASNIVGKPMAISLINEGMTVMVAQQSTQDLEFFVRNADLVISAVGKPNLILGKWIKEGSIVIDVGTNYLPNGKLTGDVDFEEAKQKAAWITPVPGGVGPMTVAALMENTWQAYLTHAGEEND